MSRVKSLRNDAAEMNQSASSGVLNRPKVATVVLEVTGTAPLIQNCFSQKAIEQMLRTRAELIERRITALRSWCNENVDIEELAAIREAIREAILEVLPG